MEKILSARFHFYRHEAHCEYMDTVCGLVVKFPAVRAVVEPQYDALAALLERQKQLLNVMRKSNCTRPVAEADGRVDRALVGMRGAIATALHHFDPDVVVAAQALMNRFGAFGQIVRKSYEEKTVVVNLLVADLRSGEYAGPVEVTGLTDWVTELEAAESAFGAVFEQRSIERSQQPQGRMRDVRREMNAVYRQMTARIGAAALTDADGAYDRFVALLNTETAYFNVHTHHRAVRDLGAGGACVIEPVAVQAYTGRAVTPIPAACYREKGREDVELVFARDFHVTYRHNVRCGMAVIVLHGKGGYRGAATVTFAIVADG
ncbi:MAG: DUF6261 family protein [Tannerella sp.]|jgi:hypothetical protein|nr:DUF6261 family protein [Tannerella sp.]